MSYYISYIIVYDHTFVMLGYTDCIAAHIRRSDTLVHHRVSPALPHNSTTTN